MVFYKSSVTIPLKIIDKRKGIIMFFKITALTVVGALGFQSLYAMNTLQDNQLVLGHITKAQVKDFAIGAGIGTVHGLANNLLAGSRDSEGKQIDNTGLYVTTFAASSFFQSAHADSPAKISESTLWGHGIAQSLAEAANIKKRTFNRFYGNITLTVAVMRSLLSQ